MRPAVRAVPCALCRPPLPWRGRCALHSCFWKATAHGMVSIRRTLRQMTRLPRNRDWTQRALYSAAPAAFSIACSRGVYAWQHAPVCARACSRGRQSCWSIREYTAARTWLCVCLRAAVGAACDADARATSRATAAGRLGLQRHAAHSLRCGSDTVAVGAARDDRRGDGFRAQLRASSETAKRQIMHMLIDRLLNHVA